MSRNGHRIGGMTAVAPESVTVQRGWGWEGVGQVKAENRFSAVCSGKYDHLFYTDDLDALRPCRDFSLLINDAAARVAPVCVL